MISLRHPSGQLKYFYECDACGRPRSFGSAKLCAECYRAQSRANKNAKTRTFWSSIRRAAGRHRARIRYVKSAEQIRRYNLNQEWKAVVEGDMAWIKSQRIRAFRYHEMKREVILMRRSEQRRARIKELSRRIEAMWERTNRRSRRLHEIETKRALRRIESETRRAIHSPMSLDWCFVDGPSLHGRIPDATSLDPAEALMRKEEAAEERKYEKYHERKHRPIQTFKPHDFQEERIYDLLRKAKFKAFRGRRGPGRGGVITKFSPERGITQRHIKMGGTQFV